MIKILRLLSLLRLLKIVNVVYKDIENNDEIIFSEKVLLCDLPKKGEAIIKNGIYWRICTIWHNKDENIIEVDLKDI